MQDEITFLVDGISAIAIHNGVVRVEFMRIGMNGKPVTGFELHVPVAAMKSVVEAFKKATPA